MYVLGVWWIKRIKLVMTWLLLEELSNFMKLASRKAQCSANSIYLVGLFLLNWQVCFHKKERNVPQIKVKG